MISLIYMMLASKVVAPKKFPPPIFFHAVVLSERELKIENIVLKKLYNVKRSIKVETYQI